MTDQSTIDPSFSFAEARQLIGVGESKMWTLLKEGAFPGAYRVGRYTRIPERDILRFRENNRIGSAA
jgi:predicted DNA-binding transcriptional regulator AlpA